MGKSKKDNKEKEKTKDNSSKTEDATKTKDGTTTTTTTTTTKTLSSTPTTNTRTFDVGILVSKAEWKNREEWLELFYEHPILLKNLTKQFTSVRPTNKLPAEEGKKHDKKCRYADIDCIDATRVILKNRPANDNFIHANYVTMPNKYNYIGTQGPLDESALDFWHMLVTENVKVVIMLCDFIEAGIAKCAEYIPVRKHMRKDFGPYRIRCKKVIKSIHTDTIIRQLRVFNKKTRKVVATVRHVQYIGWPDHLAPVDVRSCLYMYHVAKSRSPKNPVVVHCSAGIGRTASFIAIDYGLQLVEQSVATKPMDIVLGLRKMRAKSIQSHFQLLFVLIAISVLCSRNLDELNPNLVEFINKYSDRMRKKQTKALSKEKERLSKEKIQPAKDVKKKDQSLQVQGTMEDEAAPAKKKN